MSPLFRMMVLGSFTLLAGIILLVTSPPRGEAEHGDLPKIFPMPADAVTTIEVDWQRDRIVVARNARTDWLTVQEATFDVSKDYKLWEEILGNWLRLQRLPDVSVTGSLGAYGLEAPRGRLRIAAPGLERTLWIGDRSPSGQAVYGRLEGEDRVFLVGSILLWDLRQLFGDQMGF